MEIIKIIILSAGLLVCLSGGIAISGLIAGLAMNYTWQKIKAANSLAKLIVAMRVIKEIEKEDRLAANKKDFQP